MVIQFVVFAHPSGEARRRVELSETDLKQMIKCVERDIRSMKERRLRKRVESDADRLKRFRLIRLATRLRSLLEVRDARHDA